MSMFPDCRHDDTYNEDFLNSSDKAFVQGMDYAIEQIKNLFLGNLDVYENELSETLSEGEEKGEDEAFASREDLFEILQENTEILTAIIQNWHEMERNEMITSMLDEYDDDEYQKLRDEGRKAHPEKEYYDSRKFIATGRKEPSE